MFSCLWFYLFFLTASNESVVKSIYCSWLIYLLTDLPFLPCTLFVKGNKSLSFRAPHILDLAGHILVVWFTRLPNLTMQGETRETQGGDAGGFWAPLSRGRSSCALCTEQFPLTETQELAEGLYTPGREEDPHQTVGKAEARTGHKSHLWHRPVRSGGNPPLPAPPWWAKDVNTNF